MNSKKDIRSLSLSELEDYFISINQQKFRAKQVYEWLWNKNSHSLQEMTSLSKELRTKLEEDFEIRSIQLHKMQKSKDGTIKNAVQLYDGTVVESVLIPTDTRTTACVSSQVGCSLDCNFCATSKIKRMRNLQVAEIVDQVALTDRQSKEYYQRPLSNIVFMGMGEPLLNYATLVEAVKKITNEKGLGMSARRITVSTSGIPKMIKKLADENLKVKLAFSLHSAIEEKRNKIMPFSKNFPLSEVLESLHYWYETTKSRITLEYVVWKNINDTEKDIQALVKFCKKIPSKVNLIQYNDIGDDEFQQANQEIINRYIYELEKNKIVVNVRKSRGDDIDAACGQLANK